jgi:hypothetical protein
MEPITKSQHYIWRKYLNPWAINNKIWCRRNDNIFNPSLENIAQENYFYKTNPLNKIELKLITSLIERTPHENHPLLLDMVAQYTYIGYSADQLRKTGMEKYHNRIENSIRDSLEHLYKKDLSFLSDDTMKANFSYFIALQYHRTKRMLKTTVEALNNLPITPPKENKGKFDNENLVKVYSLIFADSLGNWIYSRANIYFFETEYEFITGDQPIINIHASYKPSFEPVKEMEFYYPITPKLAIFITPKKLSNINISKGETIKYNDEIRNKSYEQCYAYSEGMLRI